MAFLISSLGFIALDIVLALELRVQDLVKGGDNAFKNLQFFNKLNNMEKSPGSALPKVYNKKNDLALDHDSSRLSIRSGDEITNRE